MSKKLSIIGFFSYRRAIVDFAAARFKRFKIKSCGFGDKMSLGEVKGRKGKGYDMHLVCVTFVTPTVFFSNVSE